MLFTIRFGTAVFYFRVTLYMNDIKISVVIPSYNAEKYIARCIDSVLNTGYENLEIICVNDGSKDGTLAVLRDYEKRYDCIKVIDTPNGGVARARNLGIENLSGDFVTFLDADDWIHPQFFSILLNIQKKYDSDVVIGKDVRTEKYYIENKLNPAESEVKIFYGQQVLDYFVSRRSCWMRIYKTSVIKDIRFYDKLKYGEDMLFNMDLYVQNPDIKIAVIDCPVYYYYAREDSAMSTIKVQDYINMYKVYMQYTKKISDLEKASIYLSKYLPECLAVNLRIKYSEDKCNQKKELKKILSESLKMAKEYKCFSFTEYMYFQISAKFPFVYRWFRIIKDPTILKWERIQKEEYKKRKANLL